MDLKGTFLRSMLPSVKPYIPQAVESIDNLVKEHLSEPLPDGISRRAVLLMRSENGELYVMDALIDKDNKIVRCEHAKNAKKYISEIIDKLIKS